MLLRLKAVALALQPVPQLNGRYRDGFFQPATVVNAGVAISLRSGALVAPALFDVGAKSLPQLMHELADLVQRAGRLAARFQNERRQHHHHESG